MSTRLLPAILGNTEYELAETIPRVPPGRAPRRYMDFIARSYRRRAIAQLLLTGSGDAFARNLQRSATAWLAFLRTAGEEEKASSKVLPFFGAVACGDPETAAAIARHSRYSVNREQEYEDDFLYAAFLMQTFSLGVGDQEGGRWLDQLETWLAGDESPQLALGRALLARDARAFDEALQLRIAAHRKWLAQAQERDALQEEELATDAQVFVEGLALVRIAEGLGLAVADEYPLVPALARQATCRADGESWRTFAGD